MKPYFMTCCLECGSFHLVTASYADMNTGQDLPIMDPPDDQGPYCIDCDVHVPTSTVDISLFRELRITIMEMRRTASLLADGLPADDAGYHETDKLARTAYDKSEPKED